MSEDYFEDVPDADFLALAQQLDSGGSSSGAIRSSGVKTTSTPSTTTSRTTAPRTTPRSSTPQPIISTSANTTRSDPVTSNQTTPRVLRPAFNAVIVNTRQVQPQIPRAEPLERCLATLCLLTIGNPLLEYIKNVPWEVFYFISVLIDTVW